MRKLTGKENKGRPKKRTHPRLKLKSLRREKCSGGPQKNNWIWTTKKDWKPSRKSYRPWMTISVDQEGG